MRSRGGCLTVVPMPVDVLSSCIALLIWVRLEARPFNIPPRIALAGCISGYGVGFVVQFRPWVSISVYGCRFNALAGWVSHGRAYAGGRVVLLYRIADLGTP